MEFKIVVDGKPVSWAAHKGYGKRAFNPKFKERKYYQWIIKDQCELSAPIKTAVKVNVMYHMIMPTSFSKKKKLQALSGNLAHVKRPDLDNLNKFLMDCLKGIIFEDDSQVYKIECEKIYADKPKTVINIYSNPS